MAWLRRLINLRETVPYTNNRRLILFSSRLEKSFGEFVFGVRKSSKREGLILPPSHPDDVRVQRVAKNIIEATRRELRKDRHRRAQTAHVEEFDWQVIVIDNSVCNAYCAPGGKIIVNTGVLRDCKSDDEIAVTIGHEVGHAVARHFAAKYSASVVLITILDQFMPFIAAAISYYFIHLSHLRRNEREADYLGLLLSASAGYDPRVAPQIWERDAKTQTSERDDKTTTLSELREYFSSHPSYEKRAQLLYDPKVMEEALSLYREALSRSVDDEKTILSKIEP